MHSPEDSELLSQIRSGNERAFTDLYNKHRRRLLAYCFRLLQDRVAAEDVVQVAFQKAYESLSSLNKPELFFYWLYSIARNEVYSVVRRTRKNGTISSIDDEKDIWDEETPHELVLKNELAELVQYHLNHLKLEYREVLILRQYDKLSYAEIAAITGDTISSVESRLFKARKALAKKLAPYFNEEEKS
ncbi:MAG: RNA polymerase sigma factor [Ignavibacteriales bacterium]|nr:RNA polymerase sigma factor [Ignavibacteriales bacterium]